MAETEIRKVHGWRLPDWSWLRLAPSECGAVHVARESGASGLAGHHWTICQRKIFRHVEMRKKGRHCIIVPVVVTSRMS